MRITNDDQKPSLEKAIEHYGIKGMKWGVRRSDEQLARARGKRYSPTTKQKQIAAGTVLGIGAGAAAAILISTGTLPLAFVSAPASGAASSAAGTVASIAAKRAMEGSKTVNKVFKDPSGSGHSAFNSSAGQFGSFNPDVAPQGRFNPGVAPQGKFNPDVKRR